MKKINPAGLHVSKCFVNSGMFRLRTISNWAWVMCGRVPRGEKFHVWVLWDKFSWNFQGTGSRRWVLITSPLDYNSLAASCLIWLSGWCLWRIEFKFTRHYFLQFLLLYWCRTWCRGTIFTPVVAYNTLIKFLLAFLF